MLLVLAAQLCGCLQSGVRFTKISKETKTDGVRFSDNSATVLGSGQGVVDAAAKRD